MQGPGPTRVLLVDHHPVAREALALCLQNQLQFEVCGQADSETAAFQLACKLRPDLAIIDIALHDGSGLELLRRLKTACPATKLVVLTGYGDRLYAERSLRAGAMGYVSKKQSIAELLGAVRTVLKNQHYVAPAVAQQFMAQALGETTPPESPIETLTNRELEVFRLVGLGYTSGTIARLMHISPHTLDSHRENIKRKLGIRKGSELNRAAVQWVLEYP